MLSVLAAIVSTYSMSVLVGGLIVAVVTATSAVASSADRRSAADLVGLGILGVLLVRVVPDLSTPVLASTAFSMSVCLLPFRLWPLRRTNDLPMVHLYGLLTACYLAVGGALARSSDTIAEVVTDQERAEGALLTALFFMMLMIGASPAMARRSISSEPPTGDWRRDDFRLFAVIVGGYIAKFAFDAADLRPALGALPAFIDLLPVVGAVGIYASWLNRRTGHHRQTGHRWLVVIGVVAIVEVIRGIGSGSIYPAAVLPIALTFTYIIVMRRVPWRLIVLGLAVTLLLNSTKDTYRSELRDRERVGAAAEGIQYLSLFSAQADVTDRVALSSSAARFSYSTTDLPGYAVANIPHRYDFWGPVTYRNLPFTVIPRFLVPNKPNFNFGNQFGREFGLLGSRDLNTAQNIPLATEAYVTGGWIVVVLAGGIIGLIFGLCVRLLRGRSVYYITFGAVLSLAMARGVESDSTLVLGNLPILALGLPVVLRWALSPRGSSEHLDSDSPKRRRTPSDFTVERRGRC